MGYPSKAFKEVVFFPPFAPILEKIGQFLISKTKKGVKEPINNKKLILPSF